MSQKKYIDNSGVYELKLQIHTRPTNQTERRKGWFPLPRTQRFIKQTQLHNLSRSHYYSVTRRAHTHTVSYTHKHTMPPVSHLKRREHLRGAFADRPPRKMSESRFLSGERSFRRYFRRFNNIPDHAYPIYHRRCLIDRQKNESVRSPGRNRIFFLARIVVSVATLNNRTILEIISNSKQEFVGDLKKD